MNSSTGSTLAAPLGASSPQREPSTATASGQPATAVDERSLGIDCGDVVVYESDEISPSCVAKVLARLGRRKAEHLVSEDAVRPVIEGLTWRTFPSPRSGEFRDYAIDRIEQIRNALQRSAQVRDALCVAGVDLAEVCLIDWAYRAGESLLKEWLCRELLKSGTVRRVLWVPGASRYAAAFAADVGRRLSARQISFTCLPQSSAISKRSLVTLRRNNELVGALDFVRGLASRRPGTAHVIPPKTRPRVLFVEAYPKTAKVAAAAAKEAEALGDVDVWFVVTRPDTEQAVRPFGLSRLLLLDTFATKSAWCRSALAQYGAVKAAYRKFPAEIEEFLGAEFIISTAFQWRYAAHMTALWDDVVGRIEPDVIATTSQANSFARAAVAVGHRIGARSYFIQHGLLGHDRFESRVMTQRQLLWGEWDRRQRIELGFKPESLEVTGSPTIQPELMSLGSDADPWNPSAALKVLYMPSLPTGQWVSPANAERQRDAVLAAVEAVTGAELVVKLHPSDHSGLFGGSLHSSRLRVQQHGSAGSIMAHADVVIVSTSGTGLEACALDKPVIVLRTPGIRVFRQYTEFGAVLFASDEHSLRGHLLSLRDDRLVSASLRERRRQQNEDLFDGLRPGASKRTAEAVLRGASERFSEAASQADR